jgi:hypothetical protein
MKHQDAAGLTLAEAARAHGDPDAVALMVAAETEAARLEAVDIESPVNNAEVRGLPRCSRVTTSTGLPRASGGRAAFTRAAKSR